MRKMTDTELSVLLVALIYIAASVLALIGGMTR